MLPALPGSCSHHLLRLAAWQGGLLHAIHNTVPHPPPLPTHTHTTHTGRALPAMKTAACTWGSLRRTTARGGARTTSQPGAVSAFPLSSMPAAAAAAVAVQCSASSRHAHQPPQPLLLTPCRDKYEGEWAGDAMEGECLLTEAGGSGARGGGGGGGFRMLECALWEHPPACLPACCVSGVWGSWHASQHHVRRSLARFFSCRQRPVHIR